MDKKEDKTFEFMVPGRVESLGVIRWMINHLAAAVDIQKSTRFAIEMAVDEACANIVEHAYLQKESAPPIFIKIHTETDRFQVDIIDEGSAFEYATYTPPQFPDHYQDGHQRGAGLFLIRHFMDEVTYQTLPDHRNQLRMVKYTLLPTPP